jgi:hypothetical protein
MEHVKEVSSLRLAWRWRVVYRLKRFAYSLRDSETQENRRRCGSKKR